MKSLKLDSPAWPGGLLLIVLLLQATMIFTRSINWDEFFYYSQVAAFVRGDPMQPLQTIHVRFFSWLPGAASNAVDAIVLARIAMFGCELVTLAAIYAIGRKFADCTTALLAALSYICAAYVLQHGFSFRVDPIAAAALMASLAVLARSRLSIPAVIAAGALLGLAGMVTIKSVLFAPAFLGIAWLRWNETGRSWPVVARLAGCVVAAMIVFALLYLWHQPIMHQAAAATPATAAPRAPTASTVVQSSFGWIFFIGEPLHWPLMKEFARLSTFFTIIAICAPVALFLPKSFSLPQKVALAGLWAPLLTLAFYQNTASYYYAFMLPPVVVGCIAMLKWMGTKIPAAMTAILLFLPAMGVVLKEDHAAIARQRAVVQTAESLFAEPVRYFDFCGMLATYRKANGFMTPWGLKGYQQTGVASFRRTMERDTVPLVLENDGWMTEVLIGTPEQSRLLPADRAALRNNYIRYWGPLWIAGKAFTPGADRMEEFLIPGQYRVSGGSLSIDGVTLNDGQTIDVARGTHRIASAAPGNVRLVWNEIDNPPTKPPPEGNFWVGFCDGC